MIDIIFAVLYGPHFICVQYLPHAAELVSLCRRSKLTPSLQAGLIASLQLARCSLPYLSDRTVMDLLQVFETTCLLTSQNRNLFLPENFCYFFVFQTFQVILN